MDKKELKKLRNRTKHDFLHTFFPSSTGYQEIEVNGFHLINQFNATNNSWQVAIYTKESFIKKQYLQSSHSELFNNNSWDRNEKPKPSINSQTA